MILPPFKTKGKGGARFYCLAFVPARYSQKSKFKIPAAHGLYFCDHKRYSRFNFHTYTDDGKLLACSSMHLHHDNVDAALFLASLGMQSFLEVHPAMWRLFPKQKIPSRFRLPAYARVRRQLCALLYTFRSNETIKRVTSDLPKSPLIICDKSAKRLAVEDVPEDYGEFKKVILASHRRPK
jgi:hypothetical protein